MAGQAEITEFFLYPLPSREAIASFFFLPFYPAQSFSERGSAEKEQFYSAHFATLANSPGADEAGGDYLFTHVFDCFNGDNVRDNWTNSTFSRSGW
jgi:hypothetical protein